MKRCLIAVFFTLLLCASACSGQPDYNDGWNDGWSDGYAAGVEAAEFDHMLHEGEEYGKGYDDGYSAGYWDGSSDHHVESTLPAEIESAYDRACDKTGLSVYEAWNNILVYNDGGEYNGITVSYQEYLQSVETLVWFCSFMDNINIYS